MTLSYQRQAKISPNLLPAFSLNAILKTFVNHLIPRDRQIDRRHLNAKCEIINGWRLQNYCVTFSSCIWLTKPTNHRFNPTRGKYNNSSSLRQCAKSTRNLRAHFRNGRRFIQQGYGTWTVAGKLFSTSPQFLSLSLHLLSFLGDEMKCWQMWCETFEDAADVAPHAGPFPAFLLLSVFPLSSLIRRYFFLPILRHNGAG